MEPIAFINAFLRVIHILAGALWTGLAFAVAIYVVPAQLSAGRGGLAFIKALYGETTFGRIFAIVGGATVLAGLLLYATGSADRFSNLGNAVLGIGAAAGIAAAGHGSAVGKYAAQYHDALVKNDGDTANGSIEAIGDKLRRNTRISFGIIMVALFLMASARYLP